MKNIILIMWMLCTFPAFSQVEDDFSDGELLNNPEWLGNLASFRVNEDQQLQLDAEGAGSAFLSTALMTFGETEWRCWIRLKFSPSANNNARLYLLADRHELNTPLDGYFLQLGESGSGDAICLFRQQAESAELVCRGNDGLIASSFIISLKVVYNNGQWDIFADPGGGEDYRPEASGFSECQLSEGFMGPVCNFTSSNSNKFYFDNVYCGPVIIDQTAPSVRSLEAAKHSLTLLFSEPLEQLSAEDRDHYRLDQGMGVPDSAYLDPENSSMVHLAFAGGLANANSYSLEINNICDLSGNCLVDTTIWFSFFIPGPFDVVINEIMADPLPSAGLPEHEYLELHNLTGFDVSMENWVLGVGHSDKLLGGAIIGAHGYLVLCGEDAAFELSFWGPVCGLPGLSLTNSGQSLSLRDGQGHMISRVEYDESWYGNDEKADGGWSLELVNPYNPCAGKGNWKASVHMEGGTPGAQNSTFDETEYPVFIEKTCYVNDSTFELHFNQIMDTANLDDPASYDLDHGLGNPVLASFQEEQTEKVSLAFSRALQKGIIYHLNVNYGLQNCAGQPLRDEGPVRLGIPEKAAYNDLVINEILFNPLAGGEDYVEIYNRSQKIIELSGIRLLSIKTGFPNPGDTVARPITESCLLLFPGDYLLLSGDARAVRDSYYTSNPEAFITMASFPSYNNDEGQVALAGAANGLIDHFHYREGMHHPLLNCVDGVSLERVHYDLPSNDPENWHSAAASAGFGTPGYQNSQFLPSGAQSGTIYVEPGIIFPGQYSFNGSNLGIHYQFDMPGNIANALIFDSRGYLVRNLVQNEILGTEGMFVWNGLDDRNLVVPPGIYIVLVEVFDIRGKVSRYKKAAAVGQR